MGKGRSDTVSIIPRRAKALAFLRYGGLDPLYKRLPQSHRTVAQALQRGVLQEELADAMAKEVGADAWAFITGSRNDLVDPVAA